MLSLVCPTRNRPKNVKRFLKSYTETVTPEQQKQLEFLFYIDNDDTVSKLAIEEAVKEYSITSKIVIHIGERIHMSSVANTLAMMASYDLILLTGDDSITKPGWLDKLLEGTKVYPDKIFMVFGNDGYTDPNFGTHFIVHKKWIEIQGFYMPPYFSSDYADTWYNEIGDMIGRKVIIPNVGIEHLHYLAGKSEYDKTYQERIAMKQLYRPDIAFVNTRNERIAIANKLKAYIESCSQNKN